MFQIGDGQLMAMMMMMMVMVMTPMVTSSQIQSNIGIELLCFATVESCISLFNHDYDYDGNNYDDHYGNSSQVKDKFE